MTATAETPETTYVATTSHVRVEGEWVSVDQLETEHGITLEQWRNRQLGMRALTDEEYDLKFFFDNEWSDVAFGD